MKLSRRIIVLLLISIFTVPASMPAKPEQEKKKEEDKNKPEQQANAGQPVHLKYIRKAGQTYRVQVVSNSVKHRKGRKTESHQDCTYDAKILAVEKDQGIKLEWVLEECKIKEERLAALAEDDKNFLKKIAAKMKGLRFEFLIDSENNVSLTNQAELKEQFANTKKLLLAVQKKEGASASALMMMASLLNERMMARAISVNISYLIAYRDVAMNVGEPKSGRVQQDMLVGNPIPMDMTIGLESYDPNSDLAVFYMKSKAREADILQWMKDTIKMLGGKEIPEEEFQKIKGASLTSTYKAEVYSKTGWARTIVNTNIMSIPGFPASTSSTSLTIAMPATKN